MKQRSDANQEESLLAKVRAAKSLGSFSTDELETARAAIARRRAQDEEEDMLSENIERILKRRYKEFSENATREVLPRAKAENANLRTLPQLPEHPMSIGDVNMLMTDVPIVVAPFSTAVIELAHKLIVQTGGVRPSIGVHIIVEEDDQAPRVVVRWEVDRTMRAEELHSLLPLLKSAYEKDITGYRESGAGWKITTGYRTFQDKAESAKQGIYLGPMTHYTAFVPGLFVYRKFKNKAEAQVLQQSHPIDWLSRFLGNEPARTQTYVELRDGGRSKDNPIGLAQDEFLMLVTQVSYLLKNQKLIEPAPLWAAIYRELNKIGTHTLDRESLWGTQQTLDILERAMLLPFQNPKAAAALHIVGESVLLVGVPGVGKTLLEHYLMTSDYNAIFAAVDSDILRLDLVKSDPSASTTLMRVDRIMRRTTLPVILIIDDIDVILKEDAVVSKFLNMMQGIRQKGLLVLASTNYPEKIDQRLLEPGRLSKVVHVRLPGREDREGVLMTYLRLLPFDSDALRVSVAKQVAGETEGWSQRFLWELVQDACRYCALKEDKTLRIDHFHTALPYLEGRLAIARLQEWETRIEQEVVKRTAFGFLT